MKVSILSSFSLLLLMSTTSYAAIEHDLQSLQHHLVALEGTLIGKPPAGGGGVQQPEKTWQDLVDEFIRDFDTYNTIDMNALNEQGKANADFDKAFADIFKKMVVDLNNINAQKAPDQKTAVAISKILSAKAAVIKDFLDFVGANIVGLEAPESEVEAGKIEKLLDESSKLWWENAKQGPAPIGGGGGVQPPVGVSVPTIGVPGIPGEISSKQLALLLQDTEKTFQFLAQNMNEFIRILGNFVKFTQGEVNAIEESPQLNDLVVLLSQNYMQTNEKSLESYLAKLEKMRSEVKDPKQAAKVYEFLHGIHEEINKFLTYLDATWKAHRQPWEQVKFIHKHTFSGVQEKSHAAHHFENAVLRNTGIIKLDNIANNLEDRLKYWKAKAEAAASIGGMQQPPPIPVLPGREEVIAPVTEINDLNQILSAMVDDYNKLQKSMDAFENQLHVFDDFIHKNKVEGQLSVFSDLVDTLQPMGDLIAGLHAKLTAVNAYKDQITNYEDARAIYYVLEDIRRKIDLFVENIEEYRKENSGLMLGLITYKASRSIPAEQNLGAHFKHWITSNPAIRQMEITKHGGTLSISHKDTFADDLDRALRLWEYKVKQLQPHKWLEA